MKEKKVKQNADKPKEPGTFKGMSHLKNKQ